MKELTDRQREVLDAIRDLTREKGKPPTIQELGKRVGYADPNSAQYIVERLIAAGRLTREAHQWRSLRIVGDPEWLSIAVPADVLDALRVHAETLAGGDVAEMAARVLAGWVSCQTQGD